MKVGSKESLLKTALPACPLKYIVMLYIYIVMTYKPYTHKQIDKLCNNALEEVVRIVKQDRKHFSEHNCIPIKGHSFSEEEDAIFAKKEHSFPS